MPPPIPIPRPAWPPSTINICTTLSMIEAMGRSEGDFQKFKEHVMGAAPRLKLDTLTGPQVMELIKAEIPRYLDLTKPFEEQENTGIERLVKSASQKKREGETIAGSSIGKSQISQVISALESARLNFQHEYKSCSNAQNSLRNDTRIRQFEAAVKHDEPKRAEKAQITKAAGSSSESLTDTYTVEELRKYMFKATIPLGDDREATVLGALADNAKHDQTGRVDEHDVLRHKHVELCGVGAFAMMFFGYFHIAENSVPDFSPNFSDTTYGEYGRRDWYTYHVFSTGIGTKEMSYQGQTEQALAIQKPWAAGTRVVPSKNCYDRALPVGALLGAAFFNSAKPELYQVARDCLDPPDEISKAIFPWIEGEQ
ncbi:hypothetical protein DFH09DRAFT_1289918 [Mycena vulgaris]|nr:hypothetical protein DFH09DRAFT_1289918 [Mycena vulgaris]